ncbi:phosphoglucosamine mutase [Citroniella saccharovorans]|uniref:Phosphoglucosamine mutase n=1 Tax=Citroniella saccharovorans TaxID=2053367 RepID=A0AAW9MQW8_9FIRM|nr:phosphoglucosamine mutase [Citroniella saccharovorans]MEB3430043.1 phosphoglucosamine mutase [Citroniella saccharovorans]
MRKYFGTDGIRGLAGRELTASLSYMACKSASYILKSDYKNKVIIGRDTRLSGEMLFTAAAAGIMSEGIDVIDAGIIPTPAIAYLTRKLGCAFGIMISASHNPYEFNGIKFFNEDGFKLSDETELKIEDLIDHPEKFGEDAVDDKVGVFRKGESLHRIYIDFLKSTVNANLSGLKIAIDTARGATSTIARSVFTELGAKKVIIVNENYSGIDINENCGSTHPNIIQNIVLENNCDIGISYDGDGDRLIAVDEKGNIMDGDHYLGAVGLYMKKKGLLDNDKITATVMANIGLTKFCRDNNIELVHTSVGDRYVLEEMQKNKGAIGGEQSGHFIFLNDNTTGDGILSSLKLIEVMLNERKKLSYLNEMVTSYPQVLLNARVKNENKKNYDNDPEISKLIKEIEKEFEGEGRVLIRASGTEPLVRVMIEGKDKAKLEEKANVLKNLIEKRLG